MDDVVSALTMEDGGIVRVIRARVDAERFSMAWPLGLVELVGEVYGMVLATDHEMAWAMKLQLPDIDPEHAELYESILRVRVAGAAAELARQGVQGLWVPMAYQRDKEDGQIELGVALFAWPSDDEPRSDRWVWDAASRLVGALPKQVSGLEHAGLPKFIDIGPRPRSELGTLFVDAGVLDGELLLLSHTEPDADSALWSAFGPPGEIRYVPMIGIAIASDEEE